MRKILLRENKHIEASTSTGIRKRRLFTEVLRMAFLFLILLTGLSGGVARVVDRTGPPENLDAVHAFMDIPDSTIERLYNDGIVVLGNDQYWSLSDPDPINSNGYGWYLGNFRPQGYAPFSIETYVDSGTFDYAAKPLMQDVSVVVTADACLWLFHIIFDDMLKMTEKLYLDEDVKVLVAGLREASLEKYDACTSETHPNVCEAYRQLAIFSLVADRLLNSQTTIPDALTSDVLALVEIIEEPPSDYHCYPAEYDWSQFKPRGHYAGDEQLERYFRAVKWISKRTWQIMPLEDMGGGADPPPEFQRYPVEAIAAAWLAKIITLHRDLDEKWHRIYDLTALLAGVADSITPAVAYGAFSNVLGASYNPEALANPALLNAAITEFKKDKYPASLIGLICCMKLDGHICGYPEKYFQVMGERYLVDAELFQRIGDGYPYTPKEDVIHALDIAAGVLGSSNAQRIIREMPEPQGEELEAYDIPYLKELEETMDEEDWTSTSVYNGWLNALRGLVLDIPTTAPAPEFAHTRPYGDKQVMTALASWTHLRRDFILYGKMSDSGTICLGGYGLVEPCPELYRRLANLCGLVDDCFTSYGIVLDGIPTPRDPYYFSWRSSAYQLNLSTALRDLKTRLYEFHTYAEKEMRGEALTCDEQNKIHLFGAWVFDQYFKNIQEKLPAQIADVHRDNWSGILEEATGWFNPALYLYKQPGGPALVGIGFVMSHYEFWTGEDNFNRWTDEEWQEELGDPKECTYPRAAWHDSFLEYANLEPSPSENDYCPNATMVDALPFTDTSKNLYWDSPTLQIDPDAPDAWWLLLSPPAGTPVDIIAQGGTGPVDLSLWRGSCAQLDFITSSTHFDKCFQARLNFIADGNSNYYVRASSALLNGEYNTRYIELTVRKAQSSENNTCKTARLIDHFPKIDVSTTLISNSSDRPPSGSDVHPDWPDAFWILPPAPHCQLVEISTRDSRIDTAIHIYEGDCGHLKLIATSDTGSPGDGATVTLPADIATSLTHVIAVSGDRGPVVLNITLCEKITPSASAAIDGLLNRSAPPDGADVNSDGIFDVADLVSIINNSP